MSNTSPATSTVVERSPRLNAQQIEVAKIARAIDPAAVAQVTSRFVDVTDWSAFDKALQVVQMDDDAGSLAGHAYSLRLKIEDRVIEARAAAAPVVEPKTTPVVEPKPAPKLDRTDAQARVAKAVEMRKTGATLQAIADELGYASRQSARGAIVRAMA